MTELQLDIFGMQAATQPIQQPKPIETRPKAKQSKASPSEYQQVCAEIESHRMSDEFRITGLSSRMLHLFAVLQPTEQMIEIIELLKRRNALFVGPKQGLSPTQSAERLDNIVSREMALRETGTSNETRMRIGRHVQH